jgi:WD repeat-containing protein 42A
LFDTNPTKENSDFKHSYKGHRNSETVKGVNFYGSNSDFVISGSDCGQVFFWEKTTQQIVQVLKGNEHGIVNVLETNPYFPILATSGLDYNIKIWAPLNEPSELENLADVTEFDFSIEHFYLI